MAIWLCPLRLEKNETHDVVIEYLHMKGLSAQQIHLDMKEVLGDNAPSQVTSQLITYYFTVLTRY